MNRKAVLFVMPLVACSLLAPLANAATTGTSDVTLAATANALIQVLDPTITLAPTAADYSSDFVDAAGASGLRVRVKTNSNTGLVVLVRCADAAPQIALADLLVRTLTAPGTGGTTIASYTAITAVDQTLWTSAVSQSTWQTVTTDVRVQNLMAYSDALGGGTTNYTNTLTYTVVAQ